MVSAAGPLVSSLSEAGLWDSRELGTKIMFPTFVFIEGSTFFFFQSPVHQSLAPDERSCFICIDPRYKLLAFHPEQLQLWLCNSCLSMTL